jgi:hypothetical protein
MHFIPPPKYHNVFGVSVLLNSEPNYEHFDNYLVINMMNQCNLFRFVAGRLSAHSTSTRAMLRRWAHPTRPSTTCCAILAATTRTHYPQPQARHPSTCPCSGSATTRSSVAPSARVVAYRVCYPPVHGSKCFDAAIHDGVHVLPLSLHYKKSTDFRQSESVENKGNPTKIRLLLAAIGYFRRYLATKNISPKNTVVL